MGWGHGANGAPFSSVSARFRKTRRYTNVVCCEVLPTPPRTTPCPPPPPPPRVLTDSWGVGRIRTGCSRPPVGLGNPVTQSRGDSVCFGLGVMFLTFIPILTLQKEEQ